MCIRDRYDIFYLSVIYTGDHILSSIFRNLIQVTVCSCCNKMCIRDRVQLVTPITKDRLRILASPMIACSKMIRSKMCIRDSC